MIVPIPLMFEEARCIAWSCNKGATGATWRTLVQPISGSFLAPSDTGNSHPIFSGMCDVLA